MSSKMLRLVCAWGIVLAGGATFATVCAGQEAPSVLLWPNGAPGALGDRPEDKPQLYVYLVGRDPADKAEADTDAANKAEADNRQGPFPAVVVCPGGGYGGLAISYEGHDIARWLNGLGVSAFVLDYRHRGKGYGHPAPLQDAQRAIRTVRARAAEWKIDPAKIGILGFSAGGHLASSAGVHFLEADENSSDPVERTSSRPDFLVLCYPVIALGESYTHQGSQSNLLGAGVDEALIRSMSSEKQVTAATPPAFLWHTSEDEPVPSQNSVAFYLALRKAGVPAELHIFEKGRHGLGLAADAPGASAWPKQCEEWLRVRGVLSSIPKE